MVNIAKRMRGLKPLLTIRNGHGAAILPPAPAPQLVHVHLRAPPADHSSPVHSARKFWRNHLRRLKFHNPALPITVDYARAGVNDTVTLTLQFEHKDPEVLQRIAGNVASRVKKTVIQNKVPDEMSEEEKEILARQQSPNFRNAPVSWKSKEEEAAAMDQAAIDAEAEPEKAPEEFPTDIDVSTLPSDAVEPSPIPTSVKGAPTLYRRSVTLGLRDRGTGYIWNWFKDRTRCTELGKSKEDYKQEGELAAFFKQSSIDRQRVKEGEMLFGKRRRICRGRGERLMR